jgi:hypothetical protein
MVNPGVASCRRDPQQGSLSPELTRMIRLTDVLFELYFSSNDMLHKFEEPLYRERGENDHERT